MKPAVVSDDGTTAVVSIEVKKPLALVPWVLSSGGDVEVLRPAALRSAVREAARALLQRNGGRKAGP